MIPLYWVVFLTLCHERGIDRLTAPADTIATLEREADDLHRKLMPWEYEAPTSADVEAEDEPLIVNVGSCARCGQDHRQHPFHKLTRRQDEWSHWAVCPESGEPIMLAILPEEAQP